MLKGIANDSYALAVSPGNVPEPGAAWLLGVGVLGLAGRRRRKAQILVPH
jgi:hypothetical protein